MIRDGDAVRHGEHGQDTPPRDVDVFTPQLLDQIVVELVRQPSDQIEEIINIDWFAISVLRPRSFSACAGPSGVWSSHVQNASGR